MPSVQKGEKQNHYMKRCVPVVMKENGNNQKAAVGKCLGMFKDHWKAKGTILNDESSPLFQELLASFNWDDCQECVELENEIKHKNHLFELDIPANKF